VRRVFCTFAGGYGLKIFSRLYDLVLVWSRHPHAPWYLGGLSFAESSFFPIPPDVMLAPMVLARRDRAWRLALLTTLTSVAGGLAGFLIGAVAIEWIMPWIDQFGYTHHFERAQEWFDRWGFWAILAAGFSPIPYKIFTIAAGAMSMALLPFTLASAVGRGTRFFIVAGLIYWGGEPFERNLKRYVDVIGWVVVVLIIVAILVLRAR
jgi:membrane protein YqaA with SNARE-associated domain